MKASCSIDTLMLTQIHRGAFPNDQTEGRKHYIMGEVGHSFCRPIIRHILSSLLWINHGRPQSLEYPIAWSNLTDGVDTRFFEKLEIPQCQLSHIPYGNSWSRQTSFLLGFCDFLSHFRNDQVWCTWISESNPLFFSIWISNPKKVTFRLFWISRSDHQLTRPTFQRGLRNSPEVASLKRHLGLKRLCLKVDPFEVSIRIPLPFVV